MKFNIVVSLLKIVTFLLFHVAKGLDKIKKKDNNAKNNTVLCYYFIDYEVIAYLRTIRSMSFTFPFNISSYTFESMDNYVTSFFYVKYDNVRSIRYGLCANDDLAKLMFNILTD